MMCTVLPTPQQQKLLTPSSLRSQRNDKDINISPMVQADLLKNPKYTAPTLANNGEKAKMKIILTKYFKGQKTTFCWQEKTS